MCAAPVLHTLYLCVHICQGSSEWSDYTTPVPQELYKQTY